MHCLTLKHADDAKGAQLVDTKEQARLLQFDLDNLSSVTWPIFKTLI